MICLPCFLHFLLIPYPSAVWPAASLTTNNSHIISCHKVSNFWNVEIKEVILNMRNIIKNVFINWIDAYMIEYRRTLCFLWSRIYIVCQMHFLPRNLLRCRYVTTLWPWPPHYDCSLHPQIPEHPFLQIGCLPHIRNTSLKLSHPEMAILFWDDWWWYHQFFSSALMFL